VGQAAEAVTRITEQHHSRRYKIVTGTPVVNSILEARLCPHMEGMWGSDVGPSLHSCDQAFDNPWKTRGKKVQGCKDARMQGCNKVSPTN